MKPNKYKYGEMVDVNPPWNYSEYGSVIIEMCYFENVAAIVGGQVTGTFTGWAYRTNETQAVKPGSWVQEQHITPHRPESLPFDELMDRLKKAPA